MRKTRVFKNFISEPFTEILKRTEKLQKNSGKNVKIEEKFGKDSLVILIKFRKNLNFQKNFREILYKF